jgi:predicted RNA binding protein YcfA (HicA-like mRNA interferase family)
MPPLSPINRRDLIRRLRTFGFEGPYIGGRHEFMVMGTRRLTLPNPHRGDISVDLLARLLRQADISPEEWAGLER